jgi:hypothetical protein
MASMVNESAALAPLQTFAANVHSQNGEDGIIEEILARVGRVWPLNKWCVEFGAWDGIFLSNTYNLISKKGYSAVLIEGDKDKFRILCGNIPQLNVHKICQFVTFDGHATLDETLKATPIPRDFDFLSIDIDGCDYFIFESLRQYQPKIVCIEYNPTIPNEVDFVQPRDFRIKQGASAKSLIALATSKGYSLVAVTACNLIFVRNNLSEAVVSAERPELQTLRDDSRFKAFIFVGFDGTILSNKTHITLPWHGISPELSRLQPLPSVLRRYSPDYSRLQRLLFCMLHPATFRNEFRRVSRRLFQRRQVPSD